MSGRQTGRGSRPVRGGVRRPRPSVHRADHDRPSGGCVGLAVGESHHLANTVPPEVWHRVVVFNWPELLPRLTEPQRAAVAAVATTVVGEALEHLLLQIELQPLLNQRRRGRDGSWRDRRQGDSRSRGAITASVVGGPHHEVRDCWQRLATTRVEGTDHVEPAGRVAFRRNFSGRPISPLIARHRFDLCTHWLSVLSAC